MELLARSKKRNKEPLKTNKMSELIDFQAQRIEALERELALLRKELAELTKKVEVNDPIIFPNL